MVVHFKKESHQLYWRKKMNGTEKKIEEFDNYMDDLRCFFSKHFFNSIPGWESIKLGVMKKLVELTEQAFQDKFEKYSEAYGLHKRAFKEGEKIAAEEFTVETIDMHEHQGKINNEQMAKLRDGDMKTFADFANKKENSNETN